MGEEKASERRSRPRAEDALHEHLSRDEVEIGSDRSFGFVFTAFFAIIGLWPLLRGGEIRWYLLAVSAAFLVASLTVPSILHPLNVVWMKFGGLLNRIVSPIVLGLLFFLTITPIGLILRLTGKDLLRLRLDPEAKSYWIERRPPGPPPESMRNQF